MHTRLITSTIARLREATALAHTIPGVTLRLHAAHGQGLLVSHSCLGADLDPCRLRSILTRRTGRHLASSITRIELVAGLAHLGGGIYSRVGDGGQPQRWLATTLEASTAAETLTARVADTTTESIDVALTPDTDLGVCLVRVTTRDTSAHAGHLLDTAALNAAAACYAAELTANLSTAARPTR